MRLILIAWWFLVFAGSAVHQTATVVGPFENEHVCVTYRDRLETGYRQTFPCFQGRVDGVLK